MDCSWICYCTPVLYDGKIFVLGHRPGTVLHNLIFGWIAQSLIRAFKRRLLLDLTRFANGSRRSVTPLLFVRIFPVPSPVRFLLVSSSSFSAATPLLLSVIGA